MRHIAVPTEDGFLSTPDVELARDIVGAGDFLDFAFGAGERDQARLHDRVCRPSSEKPTAGKTGRLYGAISRLEERGLIEGLGEAGRRRPYRLTAAGAKQLRTTLDSLPVIVDEGTARLAHPPKPRIAPSGGAA